MYPVILFIASRMSTRSTAELLLDMDKVLFNTFFEQEILSDHFWSEQINSHTQQIFELISELYKCKSPYWFLKLDQQIHIACCLLVPSCIGSENCKTPYSVFCFQQILGTPQNFFYSKESSCSFCLLRRSVHEFILLHKHSISLFEKALTHSQGDDR